MVYKTAIVLAIFGDEPEIEKSIITTNIPSLIAMCFQRSLGRVYTRLVSLATVIIGIVVLGGCTSTRVVSYISPGVEPEPIQSIVVVLDSPNLVLRDDVEQLFTQRLARAGVKAAAMIKLVSPARKLSLDSSLTLVSPDYQMALLITNSGIARAVNEDAAAFQAEYEFDLVHLFTKKVVWVGSSSSFSPVSTAGIKESVASNIIKELTAYGFLAKGN